MRKMSIENLNLLERIKEIENRLDRIEKRLSYIEQRLGANPFKPFPQPEPIRPPRIPDPLEPFKF
jgi:hypothetical protein